MKITNQFQQIRIFLTKNRLVTILEKMTTAEVPAIITDGITGE